MTITSYAQNFEDVMLWRALGHIAQGFYIDIGAQDPLIDSVSMAFYEHGWRGVHVEPTRRYADKIGHARPEESVKRVAVGDKPGTLSFYEFPETGLSTAESDIAQRHVAAGYAMEKTEVRVVTLASLLDEFHDREIHWLKIDVEGMEASVLRSWNDSPVRPWVLVLESTRPSSQEENHFEWEDIVLEKGYVFTYFDGLNRFYVDKAHEALMSAFRSPPNVFDGFFLSGTSSHPFYNRVQLHERKRADEANARARVAENLVEERDALIRRIYTSVSWRITRPLREIKRILGAKRSENREGRHWTFPRLKTPTYMPLVKFAKSIAGKVIRKLLSYPRLRHIAVRIASRCPALDARLRTLASRAMQQAPTGRSAQTNIAEMPDGARRIFNELKRALDRVDH